MSLVKLDSFRKFDLLNNLGHLYFIVLLALYYIPIAYINKAISIL